MDSIKNSDSLIMRPVISVKEKINSHMINKKAKIGTLASTISDKKVLNNQNVVKVLTNEILTI